MSPARTHCALHTFVTNFTRDVFLSQIHVEMATSLEESTRKLDTWKELTTPETLQNLKTTRPLLQVSPLEASVLVGLVHLRLGFFWQSTIQVQRCQNELRQLMEALPQFSQHFLGTHRRLVFDFFTSIYNELRRHCYVHNKERTVRFEMTRISLAAKGFRGTTR